MSDPKQQPPESPVTAGIGSSDRSLLRQVRQGNQEAATKLFLRYAERLHALAKNRCSPGLAQRVDPEDIVQSVFHRFFQRVTRGDYDVSEGEELWNLFLVLALNKIRSAETHHRAGKRDVDATATASGFEELLQAEGKGDAAAFVVLKVTIAEALEQLPQRHRQVTQLRIEGYDVAEIAELAQCSQRTVERVLHETRKHLEALFHDSA
jgi:RNA polymerase sigma factor (sigma-70 family)